MLISAQGAVLPNGNSSQKTLPSNSGSKGVVTPGATLPKKSSWPTCVGALLGGVITSGVGICLFFLVPGVQVAALSIVTCVNVAFSSGVASPIIIGLASLPSFLGMSIGGLSIELLRTTKSKSTDAKTSSLQNTSKPENQKSSAPAPENPHAAHEPTTNDASCGESKSAVPTTDDVHRDELKPDDEPVDWLDQIKTGNFKLKKVDPSSSHNRELREWENTLREIQQTHFGGKEPTEWPQSEEYEARVSLVRLKKEQNAVKSFATSEAVMALSEADANAKVEECEKNIKDLHAVGILVGQLAGLSMSVDDAHEKIGHYKKLEELNKRIAAEEENRTKREDIDRRLEADGITMQIVELFGKAYVDIISGFQNVNTGKEEYLLNCIVQIKQTFASMVNSVSGLKEYVEKKGLLGSFDKPMQDWYENISGAQLTAEWLRRIPKRNFKISDALSKKDTAILDAYQKINDFAEDLRNFFGKLAKTWNQDKEGLVNKLFAAPNPTEFIGRLHGLRNEVQFYRKTDDLSDSLRKLTLQANECRTKIGNESEVDEFRKMVAECGSAENVNMYLNLIGKHQNLSAGVTDAPDGVDAVAPVKKNGLDHNKVTGVMIDGFDGDLAPDDIANICTMWERMCVLNAAAGNNGVAIEQMHEEKNIIRLLHELNIGLKDESSDADETVGTIFEKVCAAFNRGDEVAFVKAIVEDPNDAW
jgi:hypothetical protein